MLGSTSTKTGLSPNWISGQMVVGHAIAGTSTQSPGFNRGLEIVGLIRDSIISKFADEPELTITKCFTPRYLDILDSKSFTSLPIVRCPEFRTRITASMSGFLNPLEARGTRTGLT